MFAPQASRQSILLIAGEISGDIHTARLADALLERHPDWTLHALGGSHLRKAVARAPGSHFLADTEGCSAISIVASSRIYLRCRRLKQEVLEFLETHHVDAVVLCDWGGFNGRLLPDLKRLGMPVLYYFPPRSWQRTGNAGLGIANFATRVATPFQWSADRLRSVGCNAEWVGHPLLELARGESRRAKLRAEFGVNDGESLVALLPGSRRSEIRVLAPHLANTAELICAERSPSATRFVAVVPELMRSEARSWFPASIPILADRAADLLLACDVAVVKTGTATLEAALADAPQVAIYDLPPAQILEWAVLWAWKRIPFIAMPNIILQRRAVPELLGPACRPGRIAAAVSLLLDDRCAREQMLSDYAEIRRALGSELPASATQRTAEILEEMLAEKKGCAPALAPA
ncbi:MAG TPA: hypothetical protein VGO90_14135 [Chthoniobacteraceae bacterium]|nr:hypothetical protein [Chthoniobacteraceae bacterium]